METLVLSVLNQKGGVGKTTTALAIFDDLKRKGFKVLAVDLDPQGNFTLSTGCKAGITAASLFEGIPAEQCIQHTERGDLIPSADDLAELEAQPDELLKALQEVIQAYDYVIIDTPPTLGCMTVNALVLSDSIVIPCRADEYSLQGIGKLSTVTLPKVNAYRQKIGKKPIEVKGLLITHYNARAVYSAAYCEYLGKLADIMGTKLFSTKIRLCVSLQESYSARQSIYKYAPKSNGAKDYSAFMGELLEPTGAEIKKH